MWGQIAYDWKTIESPRRSAGTFTEGEDENTGAPPIRFSPAPTVNVTPRTATTPPYRTTRSRTSIDARLILTRLRAGPRVERPQIVGPAQPRPPGSARAP